MRYKTRKYIKKTVLYTFNTLIILLLYIISAQKFYLPAFFEYYTGELVRKNTTLYYEKYTGILGLGTATEDSGKPSIDIMNIVDYLSREPNYLYIDDIIDTIESGSGKFQNVIPNQIKDEIISIATYPALIEWLKNPASQFAPVYQYEVVRFIEGFNLIHDYVILDSNGKVLFSRGKPGILGDGLDETNTGMVYKNGLTSIRVKYKEKQIGKFIASTGGIIEADLNFENTGMKVSSFLFPITPTNSLQGKKFIQKNISDENIHKWVRGDIYQGPYNGVQDGYRFITKKSNRYDLLIVYKAESIFFYITKLLLYIILVSFLIGLFFLVKKGNWSLFLKRKKNPDIHELLTRSNEITMEYATMSMKFQNSLKVIKNQEMDRLRIISEHLGFLHQSVYQSRDQDVHKLKSSD